MFKNISKNFIKSSFKIQNMVCYTHIVRLKHFSCLDLSFEEKSLFSVFPIIHDEIIEEQMIYHKNDPELRNRYSKLINYAINLDPKYLSRALFSIHAYRLLEKPSLLNKTNLKKASIMGWAHKLIDASIILDDDIADESDIRYNKLTWFKLLDVGVNNAILDAAFLEMGSHYLILNHLFNHPYYVKIQKEFYNSYTYTNIAQTIETRKFELDDFGKHQNFVKFYNFTIPLVSSALYLANIGDEDVHMASKNFCIDIARFLKIQDDVKCVFGSIDDIEKPCTDVALGRSSWLAIEAYKRASPAQRKVIEEHYGKNKKKSVMQIYKIFKELRLDEIFDNFEKKFIDKQTAKIQDALPKSLPPQLFLDLLQFAVSDRFRI